MSEKIYKNNNRSLLKYSKFSPEKMACIIILKSINFGEILYSILVKE